MPIEKLRMYFNSEYNITKATLNTNPNIMTNESLWYAVQRGMGASYLAQMMGASEAEVVPLFEEYKAKIMGLEDLK